MRLASKERQGSERKVLVTLQVFERVLRLQFCGRGDLRGEWKGDRVREVLRQMVNRSTGEQHDRDGCEESTETAINVSCIRIVFLCRSAKKVIM